MSVNIKKIKTNMKKRCTYEEDYIGEKDEEQKNGQGENTWISPEFIETYRGQFVRDAMHGVGDYKWRHGPHKMANVTYEGRFYANALDGYGLMSYDDGVLFRPGDENPAADLLANCGVSNEKVNRIWPSLYYKHCTDPKSAFFERAHYEEAAFGQVHDVMEVDENPEEFNSTLDMKRYNSWNNSADIIEMMKHSYKHSTMKGIMATINVTNILSGKRRSFRPSGPHEMDCRALLLACSLGYTDEVAIFINDRNVHPDISDCKGNTALMYACCADRHETISFLLTAGASLDRCNDSCVTPLAMSLLRLISLRMNATPVQFPNLFVALDFIPAKTDETYTEWNMVRNFTPSEAIPKQKSKLRPASAKKIVKSTQSLSGTPSTARLKHRSSIASKESSVCLEQAYESDENLADLTNPDITKDRHRYFQYLREHKFNELQAMDWIENPHISFAFHVSDIIDSLDIDSMSIFVKPADGKMKSRLTLPKGVPENKKVTIKRSKDAFWQNISEEDDNASVSSAVKSRMQKFKDIKQTIFQLLSSGADPKAVKFPMPLLAMAMFTDSPVIIKKIVDCGADVNEMFTQLRHYKAIDITLSQPLSVDCLEMVRTLLECGADVNHCIPYFPEDLPSELVVKDLESVGPTLLHIVVAKTVDNDEDADIQRRLIEVLLEHVIDPLTQFLGRSAMDYAMHKDITLVDTFIRSSKINLNQPINAHNQNILTKLFSAGYFKEIMQNERLQMLTNLLLLGADPLLECQDKEIKFLNLFAFAQHQVELLTTANDADIKGFKENGKGKDGTKNGAKNKKSKNEGKKSQQKTDGKDPEQASKDIIEDYKQALELATECARILHIRWLTAKILKNLINVVDRFKHRAWHMILKEHDYPKETALWLTAQRALEIWDIFKTIKSSKYNETVLNKALCIIEYYHRLPYLGTLTMKENEAIESEVKRVIREHRMATVAPDAVPWNNRYVKPELTTTISKYKICFECCLPLPDDAIACVNCNMVSYCNEECANKNSLRANCHPCRVFEGE